MHYNILHNTDSKLFCEHINTAILNRYIDKEDIAMYIYEYL